MDVSARIVQLENDLRQLIKRWDRYFIGDLRVPPTDEKVLLGRRLRSVSDQSPQRSADVFRLKQLQHRFMAYATNWERMLREREEGVRRYVPGRPLPAEVSTTAVPDVSGDAPATNDRRPASVEKSETANLFDQWKRAKEGLGLEAKMDRVAFERQLEMQRRQLEDKMGHAVMFEVSVSGGRVKLAVRKAVNSVAEGEANGA